MSDEDEFEDQLRQEKLAQETEKFDSDRTRVDPDGTVYEWDPLKKAWFPKIDADFIAKYQMNYGTGVVSTETTSAPTTDSKSSTTTAATTFDLSSSEYDYNYYARSGDTKTATTDSKGYEQWYSSYYSNYNWTSESKDGKSDTTSETSIPPPPDDINSQEYYDWYYTYYGASSTSASNTDSAVSTKQKDSQKEGDSQNVSPSKSETSPITDKQTGDKQTGERRNSGGKRKAPEPPSWFEVSDDKNTNVYVSGLPLDMTDDEFKELMNKCGLIMFDPLTRKPKIKLYKDENGKNKGDGRCCYIKPESVELALQILDGSDVKGHKIYVERARFELKGAFDPNKRKRKLTKQEKKKFKLKQEKLFDWRPDKPLGTRSRWERIVILKNVFDPKVIEKDPVQINEIRKDMEEECANYGDVRRVQVYDRNPEGVVAITFKEPEEADVCIAALNGRWFAKRKISAAVHDGKTKYHVDETEEEYLKRLKQWEDFLEGQDSKDNSAKNGTAEQAPAERTPSTEAQTAQDQTQSKGQQSTEVESMEGQVMGEQSAEKQPAESQSMEQEPVEEQSTDEQSAEKQPAESQSMEQEPVEEQSTDEQSAEKQSQSAG